MRLERYDVVLKKVRLQVARAALGVDHEYAAGGRDALCELQRAHGLAGARRAGESEAQLRFRALGFADFYSHACWRPLPWIKEAAANDKNALQRFTAVKVGSGAHNMDIGQFDERMRFPIILRAADLLGGIPNLPAMDLD